MEERMPHQGKEAGLPAAPGSGLTEDGSTRLDSDELFLCKALEENPVKGVELIYRKYYKPLCSHVVKYVGSKAIAEDLVSEVFYDFYRTRAFAGIRSSYRLYLFRSVRNRAWEFLKCELKQSEFFSERMDMVSSGLQNPEDITQFEEMYQDVQHAVSTLPVERRRIYLMNRFDGKPYREIADELNLSLKTVEVQLYRANKHVRGLLRAKWLLSLTMSLLKMYGGNELATVIPLLN
ncbi:hypothetical protein GCM10023091_06160 [Ravibacter arvi]|uniref:RNA polymerase sigma-70 factor n=1 Tax=Ravibacter arvi TaxID=2051041 RepID=A0ABP8LNH0_9BACT